MKSRILAGALVAVVAGLGFPGTNLYPDGTPVIRDQGLYPSDPPVIRGLAQNAPPTIRDAVQPGTIVITDDGGDGPGPKRTGSGDADPDPGPAPTPIIRD